MTREGWRGQLVESGVCRVLTCVPVHVDAVALTPRTSGWGSVWRWVLKGVIKVRGHGDGPLAM